MSRPETSRQRPIAALPKGTDVIDIEWEAPERVEDRLGMVTIGHDAMEDVNLLMTQDAARRLADRMFGSDKTEIPVIGQGIHWIRRGLPKRPSETQ